MTEVNDPFWGEDINILFRLDRLAEFFISNDQSNTEKLNSITRFGVYISILLAMYHNNFKYLTLSLLTFVITYFIYYNTYLGDSNGNGSSNPGNPSNEKIFVEPTINNPFGNSSIMDIIDNPKRPPMKNYASNSEESLITKQEIEDKFNYNLYQDISDLYGKQNSQRQFYTTPSRGNIPPDPYGVFKKWLYGDMPSCKDNTYDCGRTMYEDPKRQRQILPNPLVNPVNISVKENQ